MKTTHQDKVISVLPAGVRPTPPGHAVSAIERPARIVDLMSLCSRPDVLVLLPACANALLHRQHTQVESSSLDSTLQPIHKPISGYDHE